MELINLLQESLQQVINGSNFWFWLGMSIASGAIVGGIFNQGIKGLRRSVVTLSPLILLVMAATGDRVYAIHIINPIGPSAFNAPLSLFILSIGYVAGLWYGHTIVSRAVRSVYQKHNIPTDKNLLIEL